MEHTKKEIELEVKHLSYLLDKLIEKREQSREIINKNISTIIVTSGEIENLHIQLAEWCNKLKSLDGIGQIEQEKTC